MLPGTSMSRFSPESSPSHFHPSPAMSRLRWRACIHRPRPPGDILRHHGRASIQFSKVAVPVLNQVVQPFTAKRHKESLVGSFEHVNKRRQFREELVSLQVELRNYNRILAEIAGVEDLIDLEEPDGE